MVFLFQLKGFSILFNSIVVLSSLLLWKCNHGCLINRSKLVNENTKLDKRHLIPIVRHSLRDEELEALVATLPTTRVTRNGENLGIKTVTPTLPPTVDSIGFLWHKKYYKYPRNFFKAVRIRSCKYTGVPLAGVVHSACDYFVKLYLRKIHWDPETHQARATWPVPMGDVGVTLSAPLHSLNEYEDEEIHRILDIHHDKQHRSSQEVEFIDDYYVNEEEQRRMATKHHNQKAKAKSARRQRPK